MQQTAKGNPSKHNQATIFSRTLHGIRWLAQSKKAIVGGVIFFFLLIVFLSAPVIAPFDPLELKVGPTYSPPGGGHLFGTDNFGRDLFSRILYGGRTSLFLVMVVVAASTLLGTVFGLLTGYFGGLVDMIFMRAADIVFSLPLLLLAIMVAAIVGAGVPVILIVLITVYTVTTTKIIRGTVLSVKQREYVEAARNAGESHFAVITRYVLPNCTAPIIVQASMLTADALLNEAAISFLGLGVHTPNTSLGLIFNECSSYLRSSPYMSLITGAVIVLLVLSANIFGDGLRDLLDPRFSGKLTTRARLRMRRKAEAQQEVCES